MARARSRIGPDAPIAVVAALVTTLGYASWFSRPLFELGAFQAQYDQGVYRYRVIGRELVLAVHDLVGNPLGAHLSPRNPAADPGALYTAISLVNGISLLLTAALLHVVLRRAGLSEPHRTLAFLAAMVLLVATGYVVTPYDQLSYAALVGLLLAVRARPPFDLLAPALAVLGVLVRESQLVAVAAAVAMAWPLSRSDRRSRVAIATAGAAMAAYVGVRLVAGGDGRTLWSNVTLTGNLGRLAGWVGLLLLLALAAWWRATLAAAGLAGPSVEGVLRRFWLLATPYILVAALTGYWFEVRLLTPLLLAELVLRCEAVVGSPPGRQDAVGSATA